MVKIKSFNAYLISACLALSGSFLISGSSYARSCSSYLDGAGGTAASGAKARSKYNRCMKNKSQYKKSNRSSKAKAKYQKNRKRYSY